jgi:hypothetical protein
MIDMPITTEEPETTSSSVVKTEDACCTETVTDTTTDQHNRACECDCPKEEECEEEECEEEECEEEECEEEECEEECEEDGRTIYLLYLDDKIHGFADTLDQVKSMMSVLSMLLSGDLLSNAVPITETTPDVIRIYERYRFMGIIQYERLVHTLEYEKVSRIAWAPR